jgi:GT2 family glycosyltransferase
MIELRPTPPPDVTFSVIIPTYNRPDTLRNCLVALARQDYAPDRYEVVVVDDGSTGEQVMPVVEHFAGSCPIRIVRQERGGPASARNLGAALARFEYLAFTDDDCAPAPQWLAHLARSANENRNCGIGGHTINALSANIYSTVSQELIDYLYAHYNSPNGPARFLASNNLAFPKAGFLDLGGFNTGYARAAGEDRDLCNRWLNRGNRLIYAPKACVYHAHALSARTFWRQHFNYGCGAQRYHFASGLQNPPMERFSFYGKLIAWPLREKVGIDTMRQSALMILSQAASTAGFLRELFRRARG